MTLPTPQQLVGLGQEKKVPVDVRLWNGQKLALWRSKVGWGIVAKQAIEILSRCKHAPRCKGAKDENEPCLAKCPDRETRLSALVMLNAARQCEPVSATKLAEQPYTTPSREYMANLIGELGACQAELEVLRGTVITAPQPPSSSPPHEPPQLKEKSA